MADCILEQIASDLATALENVTVANGYAIELADVVRPTRGQELHPQHLLCVLTQGPRTPIDAGVPHNFIGWRQAFQVAVYVAQEPAETRAFDEVLNEIAADVEKAIMQDPQRSDLAYDTRLATPQRLNEVEGYEILVENVTVTYCTREDDPYALGGS